MTAGFFVVVLFGGFVGFIALAPKELTRTLLAGVWVVLLVIAAIAVLPWIGDALSWIWSAPIG